jgi:multiple sugar transport system permease protein
MSRRSRLASWSLWLGALLAALFFSLPLVWMLSTAFKSDAEVISHPLALLPAHPSLKTFDDALGIVPMVSYTQNTLWIALLVLAGHLVSCPLAAWGLSRLEGRTAKVMRLATLAAFVLPFPVVMIPQYLLFARLGLVNTLVPLVLPSWLGNAFFILYLLQVFRSFPVELEEAARLEGAGELRILTSIVLPLSWPSLAAMAVLTVQSVWNDFLSPLLYLQDQSMYTVTLGLQFYRSSHNIEYNLLMAATAISVLPVVALFVVFQRHFIQSSVGSGGK